MPRPKQRDRRIRPRKESLKIDKEKIVARVLRFFEEDTTARIEDIELREQRYAKFRMWTTAKNGPFENASDIALPDMMTDSLRLQDTMHNAVMSSKPPIGSKAHSEGDKEKEKTVDRLIEFQVFVDQSGELIIGELIEQFVNDGVFTAFIPWITEEREVSDILVFDPIPEEMVPQEYFAILLQKSFGNVGFDERNDTGWDFTVTEPDGEDIKETKVSFFTREDGAIEMVAKRDVVIFDGPKIIPKEYDEVVHPPRAANLQAPSPSNPNGAARVILVDYPNIDEIKRLAKSGFYDLVTKDEVNKLENTSTPSENQQSRLQKDTFQGVEDNETEEVSHRPITRLTCFDTFDINGDGVDEDIIWWVLKESKVLLKAKPLTEMYPSNPPRRPFAEASFLPVNGRRIGMSLLETMEGLHDAMKQLMDQTIDAGIIANAPNWFYRPSGGMKPEIITLNPGEGYPLANPQQDVSFPNIGNQAQSFGINMITILDGMEEKLTTISDLSFGKVPPGGSTALRTIGGMALLQAQGEARPERILRRFFTGLSEIWKQIHELNQRNLKPGKQFRIAGFMEADENPYFQVQSLEDIKGRFRFDFSANVLNTSKATLQQSMDFVLAAYMNPLAIQAGVVDANGIFKALRDAGRARGIDPDKYLKAPSPDALKEPLRAAEAFSMIMQGVIPSGTPEEGTEVHLQTMLAFRENPTTGQVADSFAFIDTPEKQQIFMEYIKQLGARMKREQEQALLAQSAAGQGNGQDRGGRPQQNPTPTPQTPMVQGEELLDESLPSAGGGAAQ